MRYRISDGTFRNWERLNSSSAGRLTARANKQKSKKRVFPLEYVSSKDNIPFVRELLDRIDENRIGIGSAMLSLGIARLRRAGIDGKSHVTKILADYSDIPVAGELARIVLPDDEFDILGLIYQSCLKEGKKNIAGSYYTPQKIARSMTGKFDFSNGETFFDPCCGSGAFLLSAPVRHPDQLFGVDSDGIAVLLAKINLLVKFRDLEFEPQVYCLDYLAEPPAARRHPVLSKRFDCIATNPPWGGMDRNRGKSGAASPETFSRFFVKACGQLKPAGTIRYLFPEAILNVKAHRDIRKYIIFEAGLTGITIYDDGFSGVMTKYVDIECRNQASGRSFSVYADGKKREIDLAAVHETGNLVLNLLSDDDLDIIRAAREKGKYSLRDSIWALGIVTGDNKRKLFAECHEGMERIYTGKDIRPYVLKPATHYIRFDRSHLQQAAKDEIYRAPEKLVYKFISDKPVFAYDDSAGLFLNSANILIPSIPAMSMKTVMAFLNSDLFQFIYAKLFGEVKMLKGNLAELPFPEIPADTDRRISALVDAVRHGDAAKREAIEEIVFAVFGLSEKEIGRVKRFVEKRGSAPRIGG